MVKTMGEGEWSRRGPFCRRLVAKRTREDGAATGKRAAEVLSRQVDSGLAMTA